MARTGRQEPSFKVEIETKFFDFGQTVGVCLGVGDVTDRRRRAIRWDRQATPELVAVQLRALADWLDSPRQIEPRFESFADEANRAKGSL